MVLKTQKNGRVSIQTRPTETHTHTHVMKSGSNKLFKMVEGFMPPNKDPVKHTTPIFPGNYCCIRSPKTINVHEKRLKAGKPQRPPVKHLRSVS